MYKPDRLINYLNNNYSEYQNTVKERLDLIDRLIEELNISIEQRTELYFCLILEEWFELDVLKTKKYTVKEPDLDESYLDFYIKDICGVDCCETRNVKILWTYLPELLDYIPKILNEDYGWFESNKERMRILLEIKDKLLNKISNNESLDNSK